MKAPRTVIGAEYAKQKNVRGVFKSIEAIWEKLAIVINGRISFGDGNHLQPDNIDGVWIAVTTPGAPNTAFTVNHNLNRLPSGYWIMQKSAACDVYFGGVAATKTQLTLKATTATTDLVLFIV